MLIHSVSPMHMLVWNESDEAPKCTTRQLGGSFVDLRETPDGLYVSGVHSTDLSMYLKPEAAPGSKFIENIFTGI